MLYEVITGRLPGVSVGTQVHGPDGVEHQQQDVRRASLGGRITSYNVCYTKLLRPGLAQGRDRGLAAGRT